KCKVKHQAGTGRCLVFILHFSLCTFHLTSDPSRPCRVLTSGRPRPDFSIIPPSRSRLGREVGMAWHRREREPCPVGGERTPAASCARATSARRSRSTVG